MAGRGRGRHGRLRREDDHLRFRDGVQQRHARLHAALRFKLGLPSDYAANWDALVECLSSIGDPDAHLCRYWEYTPTKRLVLSVRGFSSPDVDPTLLTSLAAAVASANDRLRDDAVENRVWMEFTVDPNG